MENYTPLSLQANDIQGMEIVSALLQDSLLPPTDMNHDGNTFVLVCSRFMREISNANPHRVHTAVYIQGVQQVQRKNISPKNELPLNILSLTLNGDTLTLQFSEDRAVRMSVSNDFAVMVRDVDSPYPVSTTPNHTP